jgi:peroxiredoxin
MLQANQKAPDFKLPIFGDGQSHFYDQQGKTAVIVFYKYNCPTCQWTMPFLQKIYDAYGDAFYFVAIAQDDAEKTQGFQRDYGVTMPILLDMSPYKVSSAYGLEIVPSIFLVDPYHKISYSGEGFVKQEILNLADILAEKSGRPQIDVFENVNVPEIKPG